MHVMHRLSFKNASKEVVDHMPFLDMMSTIISKNTKNAFELEIRHITMNTLNGAHTRFELRKKH